MNIKKSASVMKIIYLCFLYTSVLLPHKVCFLKDCENDKKADKFQ